MHFVTSAFGIFGISQGCLPQGIVFLDQSEIDSFRSNYPGCTEIEGNVTIGSYGGGANISNLDSLIGIIRIGGDLKVVYNYYLTSLEGLSNLAYIGGDLKLYQGNVSSLSGLHHLDTIGGTFELMDYNLINDLSGLNDLTYIGGGLHLLSISRLKSLNGLQSLAYLGGTAEFRYDYGLQSFEGLEGVTSIPGDLIVSDCDSLLNMTGLENVTSIQGTMFIYSNKHFKNFSGLERLTSVNNLIISSNRELTDLEGLNNLSSVNGMLIISDNDSLNSLTALFNVSSVNGELSVYFNRSLKSVSGVDNVNPGSIADLKIFSNLSLTDCAVNSVCNYLDSPNGLIMIETNDQGCNNAEQVQAACEFLGTPDNLFITKCSVSPNPVSENADINFIIHKTSQVKIQVVNSLGLPIETLLDEVTPAGSYNLPWNTVTFRPGIYFLKIISDNGSSSFKVIKGQTIH